MMESFWPLIRVEVRDSQKWRIRAELANGISDYIEILHNRQRHHLALTTAP